MSFRGFPHAMLILLVVDPAVSFWAVGVGMPSAAPQASPADSVGTLRGAMAALRSASGPARTPLALVLRRLDESALRSPGDDWIAGHRVGLRVGQQNWAGAMAAARDCRASEWWCAALRGLVLHATGEFAQAEAAFDRALDRMPHDVRCEWMEALQLLLNGSLSREFARADCQERVALERRIWWMADPLHLTPENDRKTAHLARVVAMRLHHQWLDLRNETCADTHHESVIRGGWQPYWGEIYTPSGEAMIVGYNFIPASEAGVRPEESIPSDWNLTSLAGGELYDPPYGPIYTNLNPQAAFFRRGDSVAVAAGIEFTGHPLAIRGGLEVGLILARDESDTPTIVRSQGLGNRFVFRAVVADQRHLVSIEALTDGRGVGRTRFGHGLPERAPGDVALSDLLLFDWRDGLEQELDAVAPHMLGTSRIRPGRQVGMFWEMYGLEQDDAIELSLTTAPRRGLLANLAAAIGIAGRESVRTTWQDATEGDELDIVGRTLRIDLSRLSPGDYTLELTVRTGNGETAVASREIQIVG
ncbi:MAG: hypothetical protein HY701_11465 [Gemmatimonadetes bacterium]|nr:hypothetical protein [Gemmatimonadota bacterium]